MRQPFRNLLSSSQTYHISSCSYHQPKETFRTDAEKISQLAYSSYLSMVIQRCLEALLYQIASNQTMLFESYQDICSIVFLSQRSISTCPIVL